MAGLGTKFNAQEHDTDSQRDYENLPDGIYRLEVSSSDVKDTRDGKGKLLAGTYDVVEPEEFKGRKIFFNINLENANVQAQEIGQKELAMLCRACGLATIDDSEELHFIAFTAKVGLGKPSKEKDGNGNPAYPAKNEIKKFYYPDAGDLPDVEVSAPRPANDNKPAARPAATAPSKPAATGARPWATKK